MDYPVSVVIPTRNRWDLLERAITSVQNQTVAVSEIIVVDDASEDSSGRKIIESMGDNVRIVRHPSPQGAPAARNTGWNLAQCELIAFLDDDDIWLPEKIEKQRAKFMVEESQPDLVFCAEALVNDNEVCRVRSAQWDISSLEDMLSRNVVGGTSTVMVKKSILLAMGGFDMSLPSCQDWDLWLRVAQNARVECVNDVLVHRVIHGNQISGYLKNKIEGRKKFFSKHYDLIASVPDALALHYRRLGCLLALDGQHKQARDSFCRAFKAQPLHRNTSVCLLAHTLLWGTLRRKVLGMYARSKFGGSEIYH